MKDITDFTLRAYTINGGIIYIELDENPRGNNYKMSPGYVVNNKALLRSSGSNINNSSSGNEKLSQEDIDKIITRLVS